MILVDSSIWIDHFRNLIPALHVKSRSGQVYGHPFVTGELAAGSLHVRHGMILMMRNMPQIPVLSEDDFYDFLENHELNGKGLSFVDLHLLASATKIPKTQLWTRDKRLAAQAERLGLGYAPD